MLPGLLHINHKRVTVSGKCLLLFLFVCLQSSVRILHLPQGTLNISLRYTFLRSNCRILEVSHNVVYSKLLNSHITEVRPGYFNDSSGITRLMKRKRTPVVFLNPAAPPLIFVSEGISIFKSSSSDVGGVFEIR